MNAHQYCQQCVVENNSLLCVGLDSDIRKLPKKYLNSTAPQFLFNRSIIDATVSYVMGYKLNLAFYETRGPQGIEELKKTLMYIRSLKKNIFIIADAKRADIDSTSEAYAEALFDWFGFDAATLNPYLGGEALLPFLNREEKGCIILSRTSNPGSGEFQSLQMDGRTPLWEYVAKHVCESWNQCNNCMLVMGATYPQELEKARTLAKNMFFLVPGIGQQGGDIEQTVRLGMNQEKSGLIISISRSIIFAEKPQEVAKEFYSNIQNIRNL